MSSYQYLVAVIMVVVAVAVAVAVVVAVVVAKFSTPTFYCRFTEAQFASLVGPEG